MNGSSNSVYIDKNQANENRYKKRMNEKEKIITKWYIEKRRKRLKNYLKKRGRVEKKKGRVEK